MIELIYIFFQILFLFIFFSNSILEFNQKLTLNSLGILDKSLINCILISNILLLFSFTNFKDIIIFLFLLTFTILVFFIKKQDRKNNIYLFLCFIFIFIISIDILDSLSFGWDVKNFYFLKTLNFYQNQPISNLQNIPAPDYPHLGSYLWSFFWKYPFNLYEYHGRIFYVFIYIVSIFSFFENFRIHNFFKMILVSLVCLITYKYEYLNGMPEILIFSLMLIASKFVIYFFDNEKKINQYEIIIVLLGITNLVFWIKMEGLFFMLILLFSLIISAKLNKNKIILITTACFLIIAFKALYFLNFKIGFPSFQLHETIPEFSLISLLNDFKLILFYLFVYFTQIPLYLICIPLLTYIALVYPLEKLNLFLAMILILNLIFIFFSHAFTMVNVEWQTRIGLKRVLFESSSVYLISFSYLIKKLKFKIV